MTWAAWTGVQKNRQKRTHQFLCYAAFAVATLSLCLLILPRPQVHAAQAQSDAPSPQVPALDERYRSLESFARALYFLETMYVDADKVKEPDMVMYALKGIVDHLDPHTMIMPKKAFEQLTTDTQGKFGGVGIIVSQERGKLIVVSPIEDTPAAKAGVKSGDEIIAIDGSQLSKLKNEDAVDKMRGEPGSILKLTIVRKGVKDPMDYALKREVIKVRSVRNHSLSDGIEYIRITSFQESTGDELGAILKKKQSNLRGLVLDLRDNPGGLLDQAVQVSDYFISSGVIVSTVGRDRDRVEREFAKQRNTYSGFPMIVLLNGGSASASEIVAGALQDHERAMIMGTTSFGKGSVQTLVSLPDGAGLKLTVARYYTPKDRSIQAKGITPDIVVAARPVSSGPAPAPSEKKKESGEGRPRKEADLEGHIESQDLSDLSKTQGIQSNIKEWPESFREDFQLVTAYTYLKSWTIFQPKSQLQDPSSSGGTVPAEPLKAPTKS